MASVRVIADRTWDGNFLRGNWSVQVNGRTVSVHRKKRCALKKAKSLRKPRQKRKK